MPRPGPKTGAVLGAIFEAAQREGRQSAFTFSGHEFATQNGTIFEAAFGTLHIPSRYGPPDAYPRHGGLEEPHLESRVDGYGMHVGHTLTP